jgi:hypothetical protein
MLNNAVSETNILECKFCEGLPLVNRKDFLVAVKERKTVTFVTFEAFEELLTLFVWISHTASPIRQRLLALGVVVPRNVQSWAVQLDTAQQPRKLLFDLVSNGTFKVNNHLDTSAIVQVLGPTRIDLQHPFGQAHHVPNVLQELLQHKSRRFLYIDVLDDVMVGFDVGASIFRSGKLCPENNNRPANSAMVTFQREI